MLPFPRFGGKPLKSREPPTGTTDAPCDGPPPNDAGVPPSDDVGAHKKAPTTPDTPPKIDLARLHARDPALLRELVEEITPSIRAAIRSFATDDDDAEDLVQECWIHIMAKLDWFRRDSSFRAWATAVSRNYCRQVWRTRKRRAIETVHIDEAPEPASGELNPSEALERSELRLAVQKALARLPDRERDAVVMKLMEGRSTSYISGRLRVSEPAVRKLVRRASFKLKEVRELRVLWLP